VLIAHMLADRAGICTKLCTEIVRQVTQVETKTRRAANRPLSNEPRPARHFERAAWTVVTHGRFSG
jgi:hypothetical protein